MSSSDRQDSPDLRLLNVLEWVAGKLSGSVGFGLSVGIMAGTIMMMAVVFLLAGKIYVNSVPMDFMFELDTAWRLKSGQIPYIDFISPIGPAFYTVSRASHWLFGQGPMTQAWLPMIPALVLGTIILWVGRRRLPDRIALLLAILMVVRMCSPRFIDFTFLDSSFLAPYNTFSSFLATIVLLASALPARDAAHQRKQLWAENIIMGLCLTCMVLLKMHYALICAAAMVGSALIRPNTRWSVGAGVSLCAVCLTCFYAEFPAQAQGYLSAVKVSAVSTNIIGRVIYKLHTVYNEQFIFVSSIVIILITTCAYDVWNAKNIIKTTGGWRRWITSTYAPNVMLVTGVTVALIMNDHENTPLTAAVIFLAFHQAMMAYTSHAKVGTPYGWSQIKYTVTLIPFLTFCGWHLANDILSFALYAPRSWTAQVHPWESSAPGIRRLTLDFPTGPRTTMVDHLNDGLRLLRNADLAHARILYDDFSNPFPYLLQTPPPRGTLAWMDPSRTFSFQNHPRPEDIFAHVDIIIAWYGKNSRNNSQVSDVFRRIYGEYIMKNYSKDGFYFQWNILKKNTPENQPKSDTAEGSPPALPQNFDPLGGVSIPADTPLPESATRQEGAGHAAP